MWITMGQPDVLLEKGYMRGEIAPGYIRSKPERYQIMRNLLLAHAKTYNLYQKEFKLSQNGKI